MFIITWGTDEAPGRSISYRTAAADRLRRAYGGADTVTTPTAAADGYARLDKAGIAQIKASKEARLNMSSGQLTKASVGLEDGTSQAPDVLMPDSVMALDIQGPSGTVSGKTDRLRLNGMNTRSDSAKSRTSSRPSPLRSTPF